MKAGAKAHLLNLVMEKVLCEQNSTLLPRKDKNQCYCDPPMKNNSNALQAFKDCQRKIGLTKVKILTKEIKTR